MTSIFETAAYREHSFTSAGPRRDLLEIVQHEQHTAVREEIFHGFVQTIFLPASCTPNGYAIVEATSEGSRTGARSIKNTPSSNS